MISAIVPVLNEAQQIASIISFFADKPQVELIIVDGGSQDDTPNIVKEMGVKLLTSERGRAKQMNLGASIAQGDILLFLHADTQLPLNFEKLVPKTLEQDRVVAGAFRLKIAAVSWQIKLVETLVNWRSLLWQLPYGDQAIFITKQLFEEVGGFPDLPIMEDFEFILRLKKLGKIAIAPACAITSARRWEKLGVWKTTFINQCIIIAYFLGVSPQKIARWYR